MNHIKFVSVLDHVIYQNDFPCHWILAALVLTNRTPERRNEPRVRNRVAAGEQSDLVAEAN
jgi:hypothetical protein